MLPTLVSYSTRLKYKLGINQLLFCEAERILLCFSINNKNMINSWLNTKEYPFKSKFFIINNHKLHYIDEGSGDVILFVHGTPSWSFDFRNVIKQMRNSYRCIAIDHMGFGLSDKPLDYDYSTQNHSKTLESFVSELGLKRITLVLHDFGGPIGFDFAIRNPETIHKIIVLNSWLWNNENDPDFIRLRRVLKSPLLPFLYKWLNFSPRFILPASFGDKKLPAHLLSQYTKPFAKKSQRLGPLAFAKSLLNDQEWFETLWNKRNTLLGKPMLFVWGMKDKTVKPHLLRKFQEGFTNHTTVQLSNCGHFPQEEEPESVINALTNFLAD
ncbi:alpha/beta fold hydrolase [bacterium]|nr:alpha/beta fold hydrolase [bacterium]